MWRPLLGLALATALAGSSVALAATPSDRAPDRAAQREAPPVTVVSGMAFDERRWVMAGQRVRIEGWAPAEVDAREVTVRVRSGSREVTSVEAPLRLEGPRARFEASFTARRAGRHLVAVEHDGAELGSAYVHAVPARARRGSRGMSVRLLQHGLASLGYVTSRGGRYDAATGRAVLAYRKTNGMARRHGAGRRVMARVMAGEGAFRVRYPRAGRHVEFDWSRQVLVLARGNRVERAYHASSGTSATPTVFGTFRFYRKQPGTNAKGMVHSNYFIRGYAIHGYKSVPTRPASHGCIRVPVPNSRAISRWISLGDRIFVYR